MKSNKLVLSLVLLSLLGTWFVYPQLPDLIPGHWNFRGEVDRYVGRGSAFATAFLPLGMYLLLLYLPRLDPRREAYAKHPQAYGAAILTVVLFFIGLHWLTLLAALGYPLDIGALVRSALGIVLIVIGNFLSQIRPNYFFGIRNPWTLDSAAVWRKSHRVGGYGFMLAGLTALLSLFLPDRFASYIFFGPLLIIIVGINLYSYLLYRKLSR